ncbi:MAG: CRISPR-associated RAMP protein [Deltaproteobacteria bacterium]|nr:CRISPR-associated RAMP protein [Deltaproteobacteria bacterium]MBW1833225.1 CRISPR-associated RAMP protein [Deltaproteobacteria bacterium]
MSIPFGHHQLHNRYTFDGMLELVTPLRISSGYASDTTDAPFMRGYNGTLYIPGSSLRGAIRSEVERILGAVGEEAAGIRSCTLFEKNSCDKKIRKHLDEIKENEEPLNDDRIKQLAEKHLCDVCRLFGSTVYASRLIIEDALPKTTGIEAAKSRLRIRDGVGIDRDTGSAVDGAKFDYEVIEPGAGCPLFCFRMVAENVTDPDRKLIDLMLNLLKQGLYVGGKRTGGLGQIKLKKDYDVTGFKDPAALWAALAANEEIDKSIKWEEEL